MTVLVFVKATPNSEKGIFPPVAARLFTEMGKFNEKLVKAGVMKEADGLKPSSAGKRITFSDSGHTSVTDGPFAETKELIAGFWIWQVKNKAEALEWAKRIPFRDGEEVEIRQVFEEEDFGKEFTPELREQERRQRAAIERLKKR